MKATRTKIKSPPAFRIVFGVVCALGLLAADAASEPLPEGAVKVEEGLYQVPIGRDDDGCMMYQMHAPGRDVIQVISYRRADGTFTMAKPEAACNGDGK
jgi:hypothetical protein